jgi:branched-chain amino acid transport system permease protein
LELDYLLTVLLNGVSFGVLLILAALGLSLYWALMEVINLAHAAFIAMGAYISYTLMQIYGFWFALIVGMLIMAGIGALLYAAVIKRIVGRMPAQSILFTFGIALVLIELLKIQWGVYPKSIHLPQELASVIAIGDFSYPFYRLFIIGVGLLAVMGLWSFLEKTNVGIAVRAALENKEIVAALGINIPRLYLLIFAIGTGLAGLAGFIAAPIVAVDYEMGWHFLLLSFVLVVTGGVGSLGGICLAGIILGILYAAVALITPQLASAVVFAAMFVTIAALPRGILGRGM